MTLMFAGLFMYITYFILFAHLFHEMYLAPKAAVFKKEAGATKKDQ
jgi:hypothetical protein